MMGAGGRLVVLGVSAAGACVNAMPAKNAKKQSKATAFMEVSFGWK
jgi:hypothetical protein